MGKESLIERAFVRWVNEVFADCAICYKFSAPSHRGVPDRLIVIRGKCLFIEFKAPGRRPSPLQQHEIDRLRGAGVWAGWVSSLEEAKAVIKKNLQ
jgi:hypothetical protein